MIFKPLCDTEKLHPLSGTPKEVSINPMPYNNIIIIIIYI